MAKKSVTTKDIIFIRPPHSQSTADLKRKVNTMALNGKMNSGNNYDLIMDVLMSKLSTKDFLKFYTSHVIKYCGVDPKVVKKNTPPATSLLLEDFQTLKKRGHKMQKPVKKKKAEKTEVISMRVPVSVMTAIRTKAIKDDRQYTYLINKILADNT